MSDQTKALPTDEWFMKEAIREAEEAARTGDVPVGAILVSPSGEILARGRNRRELEQDPTAHAEIDALRSAAKALGHWRLEEMTLYVTLEPCPMCAGALVNARIARLVYGCTDPKAGAVDTLFAIGKDTRLNHRFDVTGGVLSEDCGRLLKSFFAERRRRAPALAEGEGATVPQEEAKSETSESEALGPDQTSEGPYYSS